MCYFWLGACWGKETLCSSITEQCTTIWKLVIGLLFRSKSIPGGLSLWCWFLEDMYLNSALDLNVFSKSGEGNNRWPALKWQFMSICTEQSVKELLVTYSHRPLVLWPHTSWPLKTLLVIPPDKLRANLSGSRNIYLCIIMVFAFFLQLS